MTLIETVSQSLKFFRNMWRWATDTTRGTITDTFTENGVDVTYSFPNARELEGRVDDFMVDGVKNELMRTIVVDNENGNDLTGKINNSAYPFQTLTGAYNAGKMYSGKLYILLEYRDDPYIYTSNLTALGGSILRIETRNYDGINKAKIMPEAYTRDGYNYTFMRRIEFWEFGVVLLNRVELIMPQRINDMPFNPSYYSGTPFLGNGLGNLYLDYCTIDTSGDDTIDLIMITRYYGLSHIIINYGNINVGTNFIINNRNACPVIVQIDGTPATNSGDFYTQLLRNLKVNADTGIPTNMLSNLNF